MDTLHDNIQSLVKEHQLHLQDDVPEDMMDLSQGLSLAILALVQGGTIEDTVDKNLAVGTATLLTGYLFDTGYTSSRPPVGGVLIPENKLEIIAPYLALAIVFAAVSTIFIMKKRKD